MSDWEKAWVDVIDFPFSGRSVKSTVGLRNTGVTMLMDKGLSIQETECILSIGAEYVDFIKFGFGTSAFYSTQYLKDKIALIQKHHVEPYPGGTFLEVAVMQGKLYSFLKRAKQLGFNIVEVSDGTISITDEVRKDIIAACIQEGFVVITEVGKKNPQDKISKAKIIQQIESDINSGAWKVIVEGRESGKNVGVYNQHGEIDEKSLEDIAHCLPNLSDLIWEAPLKSQQQSLIERFGINVNLGNIHPSEILALEALRVGLRGDTLSQLVKNTVDHSYSFRLPWPTASK